MAELADAPDLGSGIFDVQVQVLSGAPYSTNPNLMPIGDGFGFVDENLTDKFEKDFEAPDKNEIDFFAEKL